MAKLFKWNKTDPAKERRNVSTRTTRPAHFLFKIDTFTKLYELLRDSDDVKNYESPEFECCGHQWKLSLYPGGNQKLGGDGYISLYLVTSELGIDPLGADGICAMFKLFIFDQIRERFLTIQDDEVRKFHSLEKEWGFTRMISWKVFKNGKNGYLVNDCCVFGVEILVIPPVVKSVSFRLIEPPQDGGSYTCKIDKVSSLSDKLYQLGPFTVQGYQWKLLMRQKPGANDILLYLVRHNDSHESSKFYVKCRLMIKGESNDYWISNFAEGWIYGSDALCIRNGVSTVMNFRSASNDKSADDIFDYGATLEFTINTMSKIDTA